jgi:hypothetical protein
MPEIKEYAQDCELEIGYFMSSPPLFHAVMDACIIPWRYATPVVRVFISSGSWSNNIFPQMDF